MNNQVTLSHKIHSFVAAKLSHICALTVVQFVFWLGVLRYIELPGVYMDAVNPDYLAAHYLNPALKNPSFMMPTAWFPILGGLYHGVQNFYVDLPVFWLLGSNVVSIRLAQAVFGSFLLSVFYIFLIKSNVSRAISVLVALLLATDVALLSSFRTQFYIILSGTPWLLLALVFLVWRDDSEKLSSQRLFFSGVAMGLSVYAYFVFLFFLPAMSVVIYSANREQKFKNICFWVLGFIVGMMPYVFGYISLAIALGGVSQAVDWLSNSVGSLSPLSSKLTFLGSADHVANIWKMAISNLGNELMIFSSGVEAFGVTIKVFLLFSAFILGLIVVLFRNFFKTETTSQTALYVVLLPVSYFIIAVCLGNRLWVHHFSVMVPLCYLILALVLHKFFVFICEKRKVPHGVLKKFVLLPLGIFLIAINLNQQNTFFTKLSKTGGVLLASDALSHLAKNALTENTNPVYLFPDWGFFTSFTLLTSNNISYELDASLESIKRHLEASRPIRLVFWEKEDAQKYMASFKELGVEATQSEYKQRDGVVAFYQLSYL